MQARRSDTENCRVIPLILKYLHRRRQYLSLELNKFLLLPLSPTVDSHNKLAAGICFTWYVGPIIFSWYVYASA